MLVDMLQRKMKEMIVTWKIKIMETVKLSKKSIDK